MTRLEETLAAIRELAKARAVITSRTVAAQLADRAPRNFTALSMRMKLLESRGVIHRIGRNPGDNFRSTVFALSDHEPSMAQAIALGDSR